MSDESNQQKKQEEQAPKLPPLLELLDQILLKTQETYSPQALRPLFDDLFSQITWEMYQCIDEESKKFDEYLQRCGSEGINLRSEDQPIGYGNINNTSDLLNHLIISLANELKQDNLGLNKEFWCSWQELRTIREDRSELLGYQFIHPTLDGFALKVLRYLDTKAIRDLYFGYGPDFNDLLTGGYLYLTANEYTYAYEIADILEKLGEADVELTIKGRQLRSEAQSQEVKDYLNKNVVEPFNISVAETKQELAQLKKDTEEQTKKLNKGIDDAKENENRMTRNFVQIIGIFAAIIAFVVTIVPTAVRLGGASVPIALAGLAIVTAGIIVLLAMIFGRDKPGKGLITGISISGGLFLLWIIGAVWVSIKHKDIVAPPPDAARVDTVYQYKVDTVKTIIIQPEGK